MHITILGAGTMGHGIAVLCAREGHETCLYDIEQDVVEAGHATAIAALDKAFEKGKLTAEARDATVARLRASADLADACAEAELVIEAIPEVLALKQETFAKLEGFVDGACILASNTSSLSIDAIAEGLERPERFLGMHFFNPAYILELVELVQGEATSEATLEAARTFVEGCGHTPIVVRDAPGFASSRLGVALGLEAIRMVEEGVASPADIDTAMQLGYRHPMGPLKLTDLVGLDVRLKIAEYLAKELGPRFEPPKLLREMVAAGKLGRKSGVGFYEY